MTINTLDSLFHEVSSIKKKYFKAGENIFYQRDSAKNIYAVEKGQVSLERSTIEGRCVVMYTANAGDSFAEASLFSDTYHCNAIATRDSLVHVYPKQKILEDLRTHPEKTEQLISLLASQVRTLRTKLEIRNILSARERILQFFYLSAHIDTGEVLLDISLKSIAEELGLAHETLYREMAKLEKEGVIKRNNNKIILLK